MALEQTMFVGDDPSILVDVIENGSHVAATINTTTTRVDGNSAAPTVTTIGTGNYKISFPSLTPAPAEGDELLVKVNGDIQGTSWSEAVYKLKVLPQIITSMDGKLDTIESTAEDTLFAAENDIPQSISNLPNATAVQTACNSALVDLHLDHLLAVDYDPAAKPGVATALLNELTEDDLGVTRFTANALENAGGTDPASIYSYFTTSSREDSFKADASTFGGPVQIVAPFHPITQSLTLVRNADYVDAAAQGPLKIEVPTSFSVAAGDTVRFGAFLESENERLAKTGVVVSDGGTLYAQFQIPSSDFADVQASRAWKYEVQHETSGGEISPMIADAELYLLESYADA